LVQLELACSDLALLAQGLMALDVQNEWFLDSFEPFETQFSFGRGLISILGGVGQQVWLLLLYQFDIVRFGITRRHLLETHVVTCILEA
jgi:hypothetical protein